MSPSAAAPLPLRDIHLPPPPGLWPPPPGWWLLAALAVALALAAVWLWRRWQADRPRRRALTELANVARAQRAAPERGEWLGQLSSLLRRHALNVFPPAQVAGLQGRPWLEFLARTGCGEDFADGPGRWLLHGPYQPSVHVPGAQARELLARVRRWIGRTGRRSQRGESPC